MTQLLRLLLLICLAVALAMLVGSLEGRMILVMQDWPTVSMSVPTALLLLLVAVWAMFGLQRFIASILRAPTWLREMFERRKLKIQIEDLQRAEQALLLGNYAIASKWAQRLSKSKDLQLTALAIQARAAWLDKGELAVVSTEQTKTISTQLTTALQAQQLILQERWQEALALLPKLNRAGVSDDLLQEIQLRAKSPTFSAPEAYTALSQIGSRLHPSEKIDLVTHYFHAALQQEDAARALDKHWQKWRKLAQQADDSMVPVLLERYAQLQALQASANADTDSVEERSAWLAQSFVLAHLQPDAEVELDSVKLVLQSWPLWTQVSTSHLAQLEALLSATAAQTKAQDNAAGLRRQRAVMVLFAKVCCQQQLWGKARRTLQRLLDDWPVKAAADADSATALTTATELNQTALQRKALALLAQVLQQQSENSMVPYRALAALA